VSACDSHRALALRPLHADHLARDRVSAAVPLLFTDFVFRTLTFGDVDDRADNLVVCSLLPHAVRAIVKMFYRTIGISKRCS